MTFRQRNVKDMIAKKRLQVQDTHGHVTRSFGPPNHPGVPVNVNWLANCEGGLGWIDMRRAAMKVLMDTGTDSLLC